MEYSELMNIFTQDTNVQDVTKLDRGIIVTKPSLNIRLKIQNGQRSRIVDVITSDKPGMIPVAFGRSKPGNPHWSSFIRYKTNPRSALWLGCCGSDELIVVDRDQIWNWKFREFKHTVISLLVKGFDADIDIAHLMWGSLDLFGQYQPNKHPHAYSTHNYGLYLNVDEIAEEISCDPLQYHSAAEDSKIEWFARQYVDDGLISAIQEWGRTHPNQPLGFNYLASGAYAGGY